MSRNAVLALCEFCTKVTTLISTGSEGDCYKIIKKTTFEDSAKWCGLCARIDEELQTDGLTRNHTVRQRT
jgi:hypothetical protein